MSLRGTRRQEVRKPRELWTPLEYEVSSQSHSPQNDREWTMVRVIMLINGESGCRTQDTHFKLQWVYLTALEARHANSSITKEVHCPIKGGIRAIIPALMTTLRRPSLR